MSSSIKRGDIFWANLDPTIGVEIQRTRPVVIVSQRPGLHGQPFTLVKFRTMTDARDAHGNLLHHDRWYVDNLSFWLDLKILALTVRKIIVREGISQTGQATMEEFRGRPDQRYNPDQ